jgi:hypothetical protein
MNIRVRYTPDLRGVIRLGLFLRRKILRVYVAFGVLLVIYGALGFWQDPGTAALLIATGVFIIITVPLVISVFVYRNRGILLGELEVTLSSEGLRGRTGIATFDLPWYLVKQVHEVKGFWVFVANKLTYVAVAKQALSQGQQAELVAFIAARALQAPGRSR